MDEIFSLYKDLHDFLGTNEICAEFCEKIIRVIQAKVDAIPDGARVGIRCADPCAKYLMDAIDFSRTNVVGVFDLQREGRFGGYPLFLAEKLPDMACDYVIFATYTYRGAILRELSSFNGTIIDIYDLLEECGITLHGPIQFYQMDYPMVLNYFYLKYIEGRHGDFEEKALKDFLQAAVEYKDFVMIARVYAENGGDSGRHPIIIKTWEKAKHLLKCIHDRINQRKQNDIMAFWTDSISYSDLDNMPKFRRKIEEGCFFEQTYTNCPWTRPTMQAIFQKTLPIDNFINKKSAINCTNSPLIFYLENKEYECKWVSFPTWAMDSSYTVPQIEQGMSSSIVWWRGLQLLLRSESPCFYIFHLFVEGHEPILSPDLLEFAFSRSDLHLWNPQIEKQRKTTLAYLEECILLYNWLFESKTQIYFSDHGSSWPNVANWSEERLHTYCLVVGENIPSMKVSGFFPLTNFENLVRWILDPEENDFSSLWAEEVLFQGEDYYAETIVNSAINFIKRGNPLNGIAFRGIRVGNCKYVLNALGKEYFYLISEDGTETQTVLKDDMLRGKLRSKCGTRFIDIRKYDKFKHSRKLYEAVLRDYPELGSPIWSGSARDAEI